MVTTSRTDWQSEYRAARMTVAQLLERLDLKPASLSFEIDENSPFDVIAPPHFLSLMKKGDPNDPLLLQVIARVDERSSSDMANRNPLREEGLFRTHGVIQKYSGRVLLLLSGACAIHCRYCFRRHYDYGSIVLTPGDLDVLMKDLAADSSIWEVILSGGDPLSVSDEKMADVLSRLDAAETLSTIRIHTRTLTTVPSRVTPRLLEILVGTSKQVVIVIHTNHPAELDSVVGAALQQLRGTGAVLLNQAVLLAGVNDSFEALRDHSWRLLSLGVLPYYVHLLDKVAGAEHFDVPVEHAMVLQSALRAELPGYLVPRFVREVPGEANKVPLDEVMTKPKDHLKGE